MVELLKRRTRLEECEVRYYLLQLVAAVRHMHARGIIHRDLKLGNIFLDQVRAHGAHHEMSQEQAVVQGYIPCW